MTEAKNQCEILFAEWRAKKVCEMTVSATDRIIHVMNESPGGLGIVRAAAVGAYCQEQIAQVRMMQPICGARPIKDGIVSEVVL